MEQILGLERNGTRALPVSLLASDWGEGRRQVVRELCAAYAQIGEGKEFNFALWLGVVEELEVSFPEQWAKAGLQAPPWFMDSLMERVAPPYPSKDPNAHIRFVRALLTDYSDRVWQQVRYRTATEANIHAQLFGWTGSGKSSSGVGFLDEIKRIEAADLVDHLSIDVVGLPGKLQAIPEGSGVLHDEESVLAGEGARTEEALFQNLEEQMRASQKHLVVCSPERHEHGTMQAAFEALMVHPERKFTLFMVWVGDYPMGVVAFPWMRTELYEVYKPWKYDNVQRALKGVFRDNTYLIRMAMRVFEDDQFVEYFEAATNKPKKTDFAHAIELFKPQMMTHSQVDKVVSMMFNLAANYKRLAPNLERWFGVKPNEGLKRVADKCSK